MTRHRAWLSAALIALTAFTACRRSRPPDPPTLEEASRVAVQIETAFDKRETTGFFEAFSNQALASMAMDKIPLTEEQQKAFIEAVVSGGPGRQLRDLSAAKAKLTLLRITGRGGQKRALYRLIAPGGGVNYYDAVIIRLPDGQVRAADLYDFQAAEAQSQALRRKLIEMLAGAGGAAPTELEPWERDYFTAWKDYQALAEAVQTERGADALAAYRRLPEALARQRPAMALYLRGARIKGGEDYDRAAAEFRATYPDDPCFDLVHVDHCFMTGDTDGALKTLDRLDRAFGGDAYLSVLRAGVRLRSNDLDQAAELARQSLAGQEKFSDAHFVLLNVALQRKQFEQAAQELEALKDAVPLSKEGLSRAPHFDEFVRSPHFPAWIQEKSQTFSFRTAPAATPAPKP